jgi:hypothetical protein
MSYTAEQKRAAGIDQDKAQGVAITSAPAAAGISLIPPLGPAIGVGVAAVGAAFGLYALSLNRIIRDPPDENFRVPVTVEEHREFGRLEYLDSPIGDWALNLAAAIERAAAFTEASVASFERAAGAVEARELRFAVARRDEGAAFSRYLAAELERGAELSAAPPDELPPVRLFFDPDPDRGIPVLGDLLAPENVARLYRAGIPWEYVFEPIGRWLDPEDPQRVGLDDRTDFGESLVDWARHGLDYSRQIRGELGEGRLWTDEDMDPGSGPVAPA